MNGESFFSEERNTFSVKKVFSKSVAVFIGHWKSLCSLSLIGLFPSFLASILGTGDKADNFLYVPPLWVVLLLLLGIILNIVSQGAVIFSVYKYLLGESLTFWESLRRGLSRLPTIIFMTFLAGLVVVAILALVLIGFKVFISIHIVAYAMVAIGILVGLYLVSALVVSLPVCVIEAEGAIASLNGSLKLTKGYRIKVFLIFVVTAIMVGLSYQVNDAGLSIMSYFMEQDKTTISGLFVFLGVCIAFLLQSIPIACDSVIVATTYFELREIKYDDHLEDLAEVFK